MFKKIITNILISCIITSLFTGCISTRRDSTDLLYYQREIARLETELNAVNNSIAISNSRLDEDIGRLKELSVQSQTIGNSIDELIELFDRYQSEVERLLRDYYSSRGTVKAKE